MFLQAWARYVIPREESEDMIRPIGREEVKGAFFDIAEDKAPGPDGYSAGFYKATWSVIGDELTTAIQDFFASGKLLKQVNATVLSLIPKVANPTTVAEFRPISYCNVLYKAITKIIVRRMQGVMDKIISPPHNTFVPGRRISNNILLDQELFHGYNKQNLPPRCALNVDLQKAYDTLECDFIEWDFFYTLLIQVRTCGVLTCLGLRLVGSKSRGDQGGCVPLWGPRGNATSMVHETAPLAEVQSSYLEVEAHWINIIPRYSNGSKGST
ncbi:UNVERIFIED_CONTAM: hypothetical protein Slati_1377800 [Sesamum latifolium]|uniref:Reverse transcriptase domain-containing protein n=1 Tax=Sesamum latifolium TaxID=2727402 RepID=A0AAW2XJ04_9LAMI